MAWAHSPAQCPLDDEGGVGGARGEGTHPDSGLADVSQQSCRRHRVGRSFLSSRRLRSRSYWGKITCECAAEQLAAQGRISFTSHALKRQHIAPGTASEADNAAFRLRQSYQPGCDERRQLTIARPFAGSSTCRWPRSRPWLASTSSGVRAGTSGKTGRPPGSRTSGARDR